MFGHQKEAFMSIARELSEAALNYSTRPELDPDHQFSTFLEVLSRAAAGTRVVAAA